MRKEYINQNNVIAKPMVILFKLPRFLPTAFIWIDDLRLYLGTIHIQASRRSSVLYQQEAASQSP